MMKRCNGSSRSRMCSKDGFDQQIIVLSVSWYKSLKLSLRDLAIMMPDRESSVTYATILRWVQRYLPEFEKLVALRSARRPFPSPIVIRPDTSSIVTPSRTVRLSCSSCSCFDFTINLPVRLVGDWTVGS